jgi:hypothetical protein
MELIANWMIGNSSHSVGYPHRRLSLCLTALLSSSEEQVGEWRPDAPNV